MWKQNFISFLGGNLSNYKMLNSDNETFDLDDRQAEIVPALQKSGKGNFIFFFSKQNRI